MNTKLDETLRRVGENTFGSLAFMLPAMDTEESVCCDNFAMTANIRFIGPINGELHVSVSDSILPELATNMLGLANDKAVSRDQQEDAVRELANVICGNLLPEIAGVDTEFAVGTPDILDAQQQSAAAGQTATARVQLQLDCGTAELVLWSQGPEGADMDKKAPQLQE